MTDRLTTMLLIVALAAAMLGISALQRAQAEEHDSNAEHCIRLSSIDRTEVVGDYGILFYMHGGDIYLNKLPHRCPGLGFEKTFMYRTSVGQLCDLDIISVLDDMGFGFRPGISCGLGMFHPVSEDEAKALASGEKQIEHE